MNPHFYFIYLTCFNLFFSGIVYATEWVEWLMLNVNSGEFQADAHVLRMPTGEVFMIDCGDPYGNLVKQLQQQFKDQKIFQLDGIFVSHAHKDHYGGLKAIVDSGIRVKQVYFNQPSKVTCDRESPWGCDEAHVKQVLSFLSSKSILVKTVRRGQNLYQRGKIRLKVLYAFDGVHTPIGQTDINDMSQILLLTHGKTRALFTGDLNNPMGIYLSKKADPNLKVDLLKVPHHGTEGVAPNAFFDWVGAKAALVPSPEALWKSDRSKRVRSYFESKKIPTYINGIHGFVRVLVMDGSYIIITEQDYQTSRDRH